MLSTPDGPFINLARLNMAKYAGRPNLAKALFEYIFHHENDVRNVSTVTVFAQPQEQLRSLSPTNSRKSLIESKCQIMTCDKPHETTLGFKRGSYFHRSDVHEHLSLFDWKSLSKLQQRRWEHVHLVILSEHSEDFKSLVSVVSVLLCDCVTNYLCLFRVPTV